MKMKKFRTSPALWWLSFWFLSTLITEIFFSEVYQTQDIKNILQMPSWSHPFGTDSLGRDLLLRLFAGTKISVFVGLSAAALSLLIGSLYGWISGWSGGWTDRVLMRLTDIFLAVPNFIFVAVFTLAFQQSVSDGGGLASTIIALVLGIGLSHWMISARVTRAMIRQARTFPYIEAARALGASERRIFFQHLLPQLRGTLWTLFGLQVPASILYESFMSFVGLGVQPPNTSWGALVQEGWGALSTHPHLILFPTLILFLTVWSLQSLIDDRSDPLLRR